MRPCCLLASLLHHFPAVAPVVDGSGCPQSGFSCMAWLAHHSTCIPIHLGHPVSSRAEHPTPHPTLLLHLADSALPQPPSFPPCPSLPPFQDLGYLVTKRKLEDEDNFEDWVNHHSKVGAATLICAVSRRVRVGSTTTARWGLVGGAGWNRPPGMRAVRWWSQLLQPGEQLPCHDRHMHPPRTPTPEPDDPPQKPPALFRRWSPRRWATPTCAA